MLDPKLRTTCQRRRETLLARLPETLALLPAGAPVARNYPANTFPFRASSHFLYLLGVGLEESVLLVGGSQIALFAPERSAFDDLWHGSRPNHRELSSLLGVTVRPLEELAAALGTLPFACSPGLASLLPAPVQLRRRAALQASREQDDVLARALVALRLVHDDAAVAEMRRAVAVSVEAHREGMRVTGFASFEREVCAAMEHVCARAGFGLAYNSIVTTHGEVLHNHAHHRALTPSALLLADVGAESDTGYASDLTRTWPVSGRFSTTQREIYELVLAMQDAAITHVAPGVRYRDVHLRAARVLVDGLCQLKILRGEVDGLMEAGAYALFFPHGIGHLLGLDVHDMEDLGDLAGYADGRTRSQTFGLSYLRLDRDLLPGMCVTIEPGFYQVPSLLAEPARFGLREDMLDRAQLARFQDVRGIRIEDDVLVTQAGCEVLSAGLEKSAAEIENRMASRAS